MVKLDYFDRISPLGISVRGVGRIHSPYLKDIARIGYKQYQYFLTLLLATPEQCCTEYSKEHGVDNLWEHLSPEQKSALTMFDLLTSSETQIEEFISGLSLYVSGKLEWDENSHAILINKTRQEDGKFLVDGLINRETYQIVRDVCLQFADISTDEIPEEAPKFKTEKDRLFWEKFQKKKKTHSKNSKADPNYELSNMISLLCTFHPSLNYSNIFQLTIGQIRDSFSQLIRQRQFDLGGLNYAVWGGKFDPMQWIESIDTNN